MGTGAYRLSTWTEGGEVRLTRNASYWGDAAKTENLSFVFLADSAARLAALEAGEVDIASDLDAEEIDRLLAGECAGKSGVTASGASIGLLAFNLDDEAVGELEVRQAIAYAVDWEAAAAACGSTATVADSLLPSTALGYQSQGVYGQDVEQARELLAEAGYEEGLTLTLTTDGDPMAARLFASVADDLAEVGITLEIDAVDRETLAERQADGACQLVYLTERVGDGEPAIILFDTTEDSSLVASKIDVKRYNELYGEALAEEEEEARAELYAELQQLVHEDVLMIPCIEGADSYGVSDYLEGFAPDGSGKLQLGTVEIH